MSKRMINTKFWSDNYIANLDALEKLLFIYFLTNPFSNICGVYEITLKQIALDTGIDKENLFNAFLPKFQEDDKIYYLDGWVYVRNFLKHQVATGNFEIGIKNQLSQVPMEIMAQIKQISDKGVVKGEQRGSEGGTKPITKTKTKTKTKIILHTNASVGNAVNKIISLFKNINPSYERLFKNINQRKAIERLLKKFSPEKLEEIIKGLSTTNKEKFFPLITTPHQLEDKIGQLLASKERDVKTLKL